MLNALDFDLNDWIDYLATIGQAKFRAKQIYGWLHKGVKFEKMSNLPNTLVQKLKEDFSENQVSVYKKLVSGKEGTRKYIFA